MLLRLSYVSNSNMYYYYYYYTDHGEVKDREEEFLLFFSVWTVRKDKET